MVILFIAGFACGEGQSASPTPTPTSTSTSTSTPESTTEHHTYVFDEIRTFWIEYPIVWKVAPQEQWGNTAILLYDLSSCEDGLLASDIMVEELPIQMSIETYLELGKEKLESMEAYIPISEENIVVDGIDAIKYIYSMNSSGINYKLVTYSLVEGRTGWVITFSGYPASCVDEHEDDFDSIAASFHIWD